MGTAKQQHSEGWRASLNLAFEHRGNTTVLAENRHQGPLMVQRPLYPEQKVCHVCILHPPGGVVGGDALHIETSSEPHSHALITTPGATKFYRSNGLTAHQNTQLSINGGNLEWFPQDTILFPGAHARIQTRVDLEQEGQFMGWEVVSLGLPTQNRAFDHGSLTNSFCLYRNNAPVFIDRLQIETADQLNSLTGLHGYPVNGLFLATNANQSLVHKARESLPLLNGAMISVTLAGEILVARYLGFSTFEARTIFQHIWTSLRPALFNCEACPPRIWTT
ncbi:urease accessory protein UreD [Desulfogranum japonicum]|uniref:urease accessory protein UreD n=1 Tax=Desulfogranum japonicum TaxID=231447 RepID=UPI00040CFC4A|nr:urease accessory protein UreD [Desulfogranum japonicum]